MAQNWNEYRNVFYLMEALDSKSSSPHGECEFDSHTFPPEENRRFIVSFDSILKPYFQHFSVNFVTYVALECVAVVLKADQWTSNPKVGGSNPSGRATFSQEKQQLRGI